MPVRSGSLVERLRAVHLSMVEAVLGGEGLGRVAELASEAAGGPVAIVVPRLGVAVAAPAASPAAAALPALRRYVADRVKDRPVEVPAALVAEAPIATGDDVVGIVALVAGSAPAAPEAAEYLHLAAVASLTEVAVEEAKEEVEQNLRGSFLEDLRSRPDLDPREVVRRAGRLGLRPVARRRRAVRRADARTARATWWRRSREEFPGALAQHLDGRVYALLPAAGADDAPETTLTDGPRAGDAAAAPRHRRPLVLLRRPGRASRARSRRPSSCSTSCASRTRRSPRTSAPAPTGCCSASWPRTPRRSAPSTRTRSRRSSSTTTSTAPTSSGTLESYLEQNCNMNATAAAIYAHRHTVAYRLDRVRELTGLDPMQSEDRERLGLGLKAYRIIAPRLPR